MTLGLPSYFSIDIFCLNLIQQASSNRHGFHVDEPLGIEIQDSTQPLELFWHRCAYRYLDNDQKVLELRKN
jgi:hypothetical protein